MDKPFFVASEMRSHAIELVLFLSAFLLVGEVKPAGSVPTIGYLLAGPPQCKLAPRDEAF